MGGDWYAQGGELPSGLETVHNETDQPILVTTEDQIRYGLAYLQARYSKDRVPVCLSPGRATVKHTDETWAEATHRLVEGEGD